MSDNTTAAEQTMEQTTGQTVDVQDEFRGVFIPEVHKIGRATMAISFVLAFLPTIYFYFIAGYRAPIASYISVTLAVSVIGISMWLSEPVAFWPVLGSAGTYIAYLSGNVSALRFPVALNLQSTMKADINTPRGQIVTIVGIVASVFVNLGILLGIVLVGSWLVSILPEVIIDSFSFVMVGLIGAMILMRFNGPQGIKKGVLDAAPYLILSIAIYYICNLNIVLSLWGMAFSVGGCVLLAYWFYKRDCRRDEEEEASE